MNQTMENPVDDFARTCPTAFVIASSQKHQIFI